MIICARKQIMISYGILSTPPVLQRSRVSDPEKLKAVGVGPIVEFQVDFLGWGSSVPPSSTLDFLEYPFSSGSTYIVSSNPYEAPDLMSVSCMTKVTWVQWYGRVSSLLKPLVARTPLQEKLQACTRMSATPLELVADFYVQRLFTYGPPAAAQDLKIADTKTYGGPNHISAGIQRGSRSIQTKPGYAPNSSLMSSSQLSTIREDLIYTSADIVAVENGETLCRNYLALSRYTFHDSG
ncbi:MAG: hypothetical protein Q9171_002981 [Xanthocarpia ochracea]